MEWQPVKTAPRDGTYILIFDGETVILARWSEVCPSDREKGWPDGWYDVGTFLYAATHWMPLPEPPKGETL